MEFLVELALDIPEGTAAAEVDKRRQAEAAAAADLARRGHLVRLWTRPVGPTDTRAVGLYRADSEEQLDALLDALPLRDWLQVSVTPLMAHANDPAPPVDGFHLPDVRLVPVYRLEATVGSPLDLGGNGQGRRRIVPLTSGTFTGPEIHGTLISGVSADWQTVLPDGTALGEIRYTLRTAGDALLAVRSDSIRHGPAEVLERLARGDAVDPADYTFRTSTRIETTVAELDWLNKGIFVSVGGRIPGGVIYETYLVA